MSAKKAYSVKKTSLKTYIIIFLIGGIMIFGLYFYNLSKTPEEPVEDTVETVNVHVEPGQGQ